MLLENPPLAYHLTFTCYGTRLHGHPDGSVDRTHNIPGTPFLDADARRVQIEGCAMRGPAYRLDDERPWLVLAAIRRACLRRRWELRAAHVRRSHAHTVITAAHDPETVVAALKAYASRALEVSMLDGPLVRRWTRHGSTRYLWRPDDVEAAIQYVLYEQGDPLAVYPCSDE